MKRRGNLTSPDVRRLIMRRIENGKFRPGDRLIPAVIARELGCSAIPVREALCQLVGRDILIERRNRGFTITPMTSTTLRNLYATHAEVMQKALGRWSEGTILPGRTRNHWPLFAAVAVHAGDEGIAGTQRYLAGRLAIVRKFEMAYAVAQGDKWNFAAALHGGKIATAREVSDRYHQIWLNSCTEIWQMLLDR